MKRVYFSFWILFQFVYSYSQIVNIENKRIYDDSTGINGSSDLTFNYIENKNVFYSLKNTTRLQYKSKSKTHYFLLLSDLFYSGGKKIVFANSGMLHFRYSFRINKSTWKWETFSQIQYNQLLNQKMRFLLGTGLRDKLIDKNKIKLFLGSSFMYEYEEIQPNNEFLNNYRWSNYFSWFISVKNIQLTGTSYYQPLFEDFKDYRFSGQYVLSTQLSKKWRIKAEYNVFSDSRPPTGVKKVVSSLLIGFGIDFGK
ncbi:MAG: DUF481 domain-containing protein [Flavobacteriia bacterium]|nr:DUF481 domain-containing protein [Flavobacteriia bacterium]